MNDVDSTNQALLYPDGFWSSIAEVPTERGNLNLTIVGADADCLAYGAFTNSDSASAAVKWSRSNLAAEGRHVRHGRPLTVGRARAAAVVSNFSNAGTGERGLLENRLLAEAIAQSIEARPQEILMASTGVIGVNYPNFNELTEVARHTAERRRRPVEWSRVANSMCTFLDTNRQKMAFGTVPDGSGSSIAAACKGSNMIYPMLSGLAAPHSTTIAVVVTDAILSPEVFWQIAQGAVGDSFNRLNVDGARSTSDSVLMLSSATRLVDPALFSDALKGVMVDLVQAIARDGLGARRGLWIEVVGASSIEQADRVGRSIALNSHVKYAVYAGDALLVAGSTWAAVGAAGGGDIVEEKVQIQVNGANVFLGGAVASRTIGGQSFDARDVTIRVDLSQGSVNTRFFTCDNPKPKPYRVGAASEFNLG